MISGSDAAQALADRATWGVAHVEVRPSTIPAAAVPRGAVVRLADGREVTVVGVYNADPRPGYVRWAHGRGAESVVRAAHGVEVVTFP